ncbi:TraB/GumN family protein [Aquicoccus sp.]|uniref:TraB/GumN family protein n=1 Tax=Aquicoccus sp. TaxID=2055851 RepID=UPI003562D55C
MRFLLVALLLLARPVLALDCGGTDLLTTMPESERAALETRAERTPHGHGLLWQATKDSTRFTIFGTYHLPHERTEAHLDALLPRARAADIAYFEMNAPDAQDFERRATTQPGVIFIADGPTLPERLEEDEWQELRQQMAARGFPAFMTAKMRPVFVSMMLGLSPCGLKQQQSGAKGIDGRLARTLHDEGHATRSIEDPMTPLRIFDAFPPDTQLDMIRLALDMEIDPDDMGTTLLNAYLRQEIALIWELGRKISLDHGGPGAEEDFTLFERVLLTERNHDWAETLLADAADTPGQNAFVAVGAAHLMGESGLLRRLERAGYTITPLPFD